MQIQKLAVYLLYLLQLSFSSSANAIYPKLNILKTNLTEWQDIASLPYANFSGRIYFTTANVPATTSPKFEFECLAPYPIQWQIDGYTSSTGIDSVRFPWIDKSSKYYIRATTTKFVDRASIKVGCEMIGNSSVKDGMFIFVDRKTNINTLISTKTNIEDSTIIPCITFNPTVPVKLFIRTQNGTEVPFDGSNAFINYNPTIGFIYSKIFDGVYICKQNSFSVTVKATMTSKFVSEDYEYLPKRELIRVFDEEIINLKCISKSGRPVEIKVIETGGSARPMVNPVTKLVRYEKYENLSAFENQYEFQVNYEKINNGMVATLKSTIGGVMVSLNLLATCSTNSKIYHRVETSIEIKKWTIEIVRTPKLELRDDIWKMKCLVGDEKMQLRILSCKNSFHCSFLQSHCPGNVTRCKIESGNSEDINCFTTFLKPNCSFKSQDCNLCDWLKYTYFHGLAQCVVLGLVKQWEFFQTLNNRKLTDWRQADLRELIRMDEVEPILYTNEATMFRCEYLTYLFVYWQEFYLEFRNGSRELLNRRNGTKYRMRTTHGDLSQQRSIQDLNSIYNLRLYLPLDAVGIHCVVQWWNSTNLVEVSRKFETRNLARPWIDQKTERIKVFCTRERNNRLTCFATGEPQVKYIWYYNNTEALKTFPELKTSLGSSGESHLEFPEIINASTVSYAGSYTCKAVNRVGSAKITFQLRIMDMQENSTRSEHDSFTQETIMEDPIYISTSVVTAIIFAVVLALLFVFVRRYKAAKQMLRDLTDAEVTEFFYGRPDVVGIFDGRPDVVGSKVEVNAETIDFLPYNKKYEIPLDDLHFSFSEKTLLGSGEFAFVVRALIKSQGKLVALKISKPSTDITLFKSLLSEIKIMSYIGEHENINALVGVCTEGIKARSVYIATDICDLGSMNHFLRKSKPVFVNLITVNQEIDDSLLRSSLSQKPQLTTMDLISFSGQIANGMEYLSYKSVVHADLATRNVLLTSEKVAKISDFGLSKQLYENNNYVKKSRARLPWRWMALESLKTLTFSTSSDVWAYGVTLYEIFTLGDAPFPNEDWNVGFVERLEGGTRMGRPKYSTHDIYSKIVACWENDPELRPSFKSLRIFFENMYAKHFIPTETSTFESDCVVETTESEVTYIYQPLEDVLT